MVYILTELHVTDNDTNFLLMFTFIISVSFGLFAATAGILPVSSKYPLDCLWREKYKPIRYGHDGAGGHSKQSILSEMSMQITPNIAEQSVEHQLEHQYQRQYAGDSMIDVFAEIDEETLFPADMASIRKHRNYRRMIGRSFSSMDTDRMPARIWTEYNNLLLGTFLSFVSLLGIGCVAWIHSAIYIAVCGLLVGAAVGITFPSANGVATNSLRNDEQGKGFGIIYAVKGVTSAMAPFAFGTFYNYLVKMDAGPIIFAIGMSLTLIAWLIIIFPLRWVLCDQQGNAPRDALLISAKDITTYT